MKILRPLILASLSISSAVARLNVTGTSLVPANNNKTRITYTETRGKHQKDISTDRADSQKAITDVLSIIAAIFVKSPLSLDEIIKKLEVSIDEINKISSFSEEHVEELRDTINNNSDIRSNIDAIKINGKSLFLNLVAKGNQERLIEFLLKYCGEDVNQAGKIDGATPLYMAAYYGHEAVVRLLLNNGADPNQARTIDEATPLFMAVEKGNFQIVDFLLSIGADPNIANNEGETCLMIAAAEENNKAMIDLLLNNNADMKKYTKKDEITALYYASYNKNYAIVESLLKKGAGLKCNKMQNLPIFAVSINDYKLLKIMCEVEINVDTGDFMTPFRIAVHSGDVEMTKFLIENLPPGQLNIFENIYSLYILLILKPMSFIDLCRVSYRRATEGPMITDEIVEVPPVSETKDISELILPRENRPEKLAVNPNLQKEASEGKDFLLNITDKESVKSDGSKAGEIQDYRSR